MKILNNKQFGVRIKTHFDLCSSIADKPEGRLLAGLCLICTNNSSIIQIRGTECHKIATGVCGTTTFL